MDKQQGLEVFKLINGIVCGSTGLCSFFTFDPYTYMGLHDHRHIVRPISYS
jgi:hypothetical protein